jgi:hypothetical protein
VEFFFADPTKGKMKSATRSLLFEARRLLCIALCLAALVLAAACILPPVSAASPQEDDALTQAAAGFHNFFLHDACTGQYPPQPDTCLHARLHVRSFVFGGKSGNVYDVTLHVRGIFEPTTITGGETPDPEHPYFKVGGTVSTPDWSRWEIEVSEPKQSYCLNHYPTVGHKIYKEDFTATIPIAAGATVTVRVTDGNDREIDNGKSGPDRQQTIPGVADTPRPGQMLSLEVTGVKAR